MRTLQTTWDSTDTPPKVILKQGVGGTTDVIANDCATIKADKYKEIHPAQPINIAVAGNQTLAEQLQAIVFLAVYRTRDMQLAVMQANTARGMVYHYKRMTGEQVQQTVTKPSDSDELFAEHLETGDPPASHETAQPLGNDLVVSEDGDLLSGEHETGDINEAD